ncbi:MAG: Bacterial type IIA DNA topoisomerase, B subunit [Idiomarinaceae bacterium HL-53]|nr:MAG: Bacterial type IIA DNA topoisomerase, B subunit [Idiomarinaceae bacterium HL-53]CUS48184.1 Protein of unknown function (DUF3802) [Idiomarinaceae bacterium HL-53]
MIVDTEGYVELIQYLGEHLHVFATAPNSASVAPVTVRELFETQLSNQIMRICQQHDIDQAVRLEIVREADAILYDLEEVLASVLDRHPDHDQQVFIQEFVGLVKNLIDSELMNLKG